MKIIIEKGFISIILASFSLSFSVMSSANEPFHPLGSYPSYFTFLDINGADERKILQSKSVFFIHIFDESGDEKLDKRNTAFFIRTKREDDKVCAVTAGHAFENLPDKEFSFDGYFNYLGKDYQFTFEGVSIYLSSTLQVSNKSDMKGELIDGGMILDETADIALFLVDKKDLPPLEMLAESGYQFDNVIHNFTYSIHHAKGWPQRASYSTYIESKLGTFKISSITNQVMMVSTGSSGAPIGMLGEQNQFGAYIGVLESASNERTLPENEKLFQDKDIEIPYSRGVIYTTLSAIEDVIKRECLQLEQDEVPVIPNLPLPLINIQGNLCKNNAQSYKAKKSLETEKGYKENSVYCEENIFSLVNSTKYKFVLTMYGESKNNNKYVRDIIILQPYSTLNFKYSDSMGGYVYESNNDSNEIRIVSIGLDGRPDNYMYNEEINIERDRDVLYFNKDEHNMSLFYKPREGHLMHRPIINFNSEGTELNETADYIIPTLDEYHDSLSIKPSKLGNSFIVNIDLTEREEYFDPDKIERVIFQNQSYEGLSKYNRVRVTGRDLYFEKENDVVKIDYSEISPYFFTYNGSGDKGTLQQIDLCNSGDFSTASGNEFDFYWSGKNAITYRDIGNEYVEPYEIELIDFSKGIFHSYLEADGVCGNPEQLFIKVSLSEDKKTFYITLEGDGKNKFLTESIQ